MRKSIALIGICYLLASCSPLRPLKGSYYGSERPFTISTTKSIDEVWSKVIDLFATKGLSIKIIDKASGLITSESFSFIGKNTNETETGTLTDPSAWIVCSVPNPGQVDGSWNVRIKKDEIGKTVININITNLVAKTVLTQTAYVKGSTVLYEAKSTGNFERLISDLIK